MNLIAFLFFILTIVQNINTENVNHILSRALRSIPQFSYYQNQPQFFSGQNFRPGQNQFKITPNFNPYMSQFQSSPNSFFNQQQQQQPRYTPGFQPPRQQGYMPNSLFEFDKPVIGDEEDVFGKCGILQPKLTSYVANGEKTEHKQWPWYVQVVIAGNNRSDSETFCGGTFIHKKFVLTAAHCYDDLLPSKRSRNTLILARGLNPSNINSPKHGKKFDHLVKIRAKNVIIHPNYIPAMTEFEARMKGVTPGPVNDVAIIELRHDNHDIYDQVMPACLPKSEYNIQTETECKIMGHGFMNSHDEENFIMPTLLQMANVKISNIQDCKDDVESQSIKSKINSDTLCIRGPIHPCVGDSGGPLICAGKSGSNIKGSDSFLNDYEDDSSMEKIGNVKWYLCGVTSFAVSTDENDKCGQFKSAVFGKVSNYINWIINVVKSA